MNILMLSRLFSPHIGGVEKHVEKVMERLIKRGHEITIVTERYDKKLKLQQVYKGIRIFRIPVPHQEKKKKWAIWKWLWENRNLIKGNDLIHIHDVFFWYLPFKVIFPFKQMYITFHGYEGNKPPTTKAVIQRKIGEWMSSGTICVGGFMRKWYQAKPNLITYGASSGIKVKKKELNTAIYIGRLSKDIGIMIYLKALRLLKQKNINLSVDVYGDGPQFKLARKFVKKNKLRVKFYGFVKNGNQEISQAQLGFISRYLGIVEAMSAKTPVFAVYNNQIKKDYLICHPQAKNMFVADNSQSLAEQIGKYLGSTKKYNQQIDEAYQWGKKQTWEKMTNLYLKLWQYE